MSKLPRPATTLHGLVSDSNIHMSLDAPSGHIQACHVRVLLRQPGRGTPLVEAVLSTGSGNEGQRRAIELKRRLPRGAHATAHGDGVAIVTPVNGGDPLLQLLSCQYIRSDATTEASA